MSDVPKFVLKRLQETAALETHPDADLLTGFVEKSLLEPERNRVTEHLARCSACRAVVALAMPESPELPEVPEVPDEVPEVEVPALTASRNARRRDWFNPAVLRWVVATAGIVAVTSVGILQYRSHQNKIAEDNILLSRNAAPPPVPPADQAPLVPSQPLPVPPQAKQRQPTDSREKVQPSRPEHMIAGGSTGSSIKMPRTPLGSYAASAPGRCGRIRLCRRPSFCGSATTCSKSERRPAAHGIFFFTDGRGGIAVRHHRDQHRKRGCRSAG